MSENICFSRRLNELIGYLGINQNQIAKQSGVSPSSFGKALKGASLSLENAIKLVECFGIDANWLLLGVGTPMRKSLCFDNEIEVVRYISDNPDIFSKLQSFSSMITDYKDSEFEKRVDARLLKLEEKIEQITRK